MNRFKIVGRTALVLGMLCGMDGWALNPQAPQCFPNTPEARNWPVKAIYLHGLFQPSGNGDYVSLEAGNLVKLAALAERLHIRIAAPVSPSIMHSGTYGTVRNWSGVSLSSIEAMASRACGDAPLAVPRAIIGFSNGGYKANSLGQLPCSQIRDYVKILAIGAPGATAPGSCHNLVNSYPHVFPPASISLDQQLASLRGSSSPEVASLSSPPVMRHSVRALVGAAELPGLFQTFDLPQAGR